MYFLKKNYIAILCIIFWCVITLIRVFNHFPWYDEAHAWTIAQDLNLIEIIKLMKYEGHTILWYLCLMPFAKLNIGYPYSMLLINWLFCFVAMLILWFKSPFNNWIKIFISFSFPFLGYFPVVARCYSIGIMFLFMLCAMFSDRLKHKNWYALLLILCANTSVMAIVCSAVLGCEFVFQLVRNKVKEIFPYIILAFGGLLILLQLGLSINENIEKESLISSVISSGSSFVGLIILAIKILIFALIFGIPLVIFYIKNKIFPWFLIGSYILLAMIFLFVYMGSWWHYYFAYIFLIVSCWLVLANNKELKFAKLPIVVLNVISLILIFYMPKDDMMPKIFNGDYQQTAEFIKNDQNLSNANIIYFTYYALPLEKYLEKSDVSFENYCFENLKIKPFHLENAYCDKKREYVNISYDYFNMFLKTQRNNFVFDDDGYLGLTDGFELKNPDNSKQYIKFVLYKTLKNDNFYKIEKYE